jgi:ankyrin repeat protein
MPVEYITWQDDEGNSPLHIACMFGQSEVVEVISMWLAKLEDFYIVNKKNYSPAHVATTADVLRKLYEFGVDLWVADPKGRYPLFINSFQGRVDCVTLLIEFGVAKNKKLVSAKDKQGDSALHAACMCGHFGCVVLLLYWLSNDPNKQGLTPHALAIRTKHPHIASLVEYIEGRRANGESSEAIFQCSFDSLAAVTLAHGSRWTKLYDHVNDSVYFYDRALLVSQWDRPQTFDEDVTCEEEIDKTREILRHFYGLYNQEKLATINDILHVYKGNFSDLFVQLATRYQVQDLSIFSR